ncbi:helix-turn-helix transcriptional regulator [Terribacillus sp. JSM ZJ617]|uniref:helix-turn-helix transcriptional regulator n=1 Tax=Terribacillus sp. JSM ZJ617 TaxID=3342119 RepID=UPI0035A97813
MKLERMISIIYKLLNHEVLSASVLAEEFQVSPRTIYRDIDVICAAGIPVISYQGNKGGYGIMDGYKMDRSLLGSYDVDYLVTVLRSLATVFEDERVQSTIERLQTIGEDNQNQNLSVDFESYRTAPDALRRLRSGITERKVISFDYINAQNERTTRDVEPLQLHYKYSNWYLTGFCRKRKDYREFRLSRMLKLSLTQDSFQPHDEILKEDYTSDNEWENKVSDVVIKVRQEALAEAMDQFHQVDKQFHDDGSMTMRIPVHEPLKARWLWSILLSFSSGVEVVQPHALRVILKEKLKNTIKLYEEV